MLLRDGQRTVGVAALDVFCGLDIRDLSLLNTSASLSTLVGGSLLEVKVETTGNDELHEHNDEDASKNTEAELLLISNLAREACVKRRLKVDLVIASF